MTVNIMDNNKNRKKLIVLIVSLSLVIIILATFTMLFIFNTDFALAFSKKTSTTYNVTDAVYKNPLMGFAASATSRSNVGDNSLVYIDITFRELEPEQGVFDFETIVEENYIERWKSAGKHAVLRFVCDIPRDEEHMDIPDWLYELTGDGTSYEFSDGRKGYSPDYNNPVFIEYHAKAIKALGEYFAGDNFISYIELGSLGHWGEWHVSYSDGIIRMPKSNVRQKYIDPYTEAFPNAILMMRRPFIVAKENNYGLFNDMFGNPDSIESWKEWLSVGGDYNQAEENDQLVPMEEAWKTAPIGGEFTDSYEMSWILIDNFEETKKMLEESHTTFLGPKFPKVKDDETPDPDFLESIDEVLLRMGYRFNITKSVLEKSLINDTARLELTWRNSGVAPIYFDWPVYLYVTDSAGEVIDRVKIELDLTKLKPGIDYVTTTDFKFSEYDNKNIRLCVGIVDPQADKPAINLTSDNEKIGLLSVVYKNIA